MDLKSFFNIDEIIQELQETKIMRWKLVYFVVKICTPVVLLTIFISPKIAAMFMFAFVAFVSAVPATTAVVLRATEMMDFFFCNCCNIHWSCSRHCFCSSYFVYINFFFAHGKAALFCHRTSQYYSSLPVRARAYDFFE